LVKIKKGNFVVHPKTFSRAYSNAYQFFSTREEFVQYYSQGNVILQVEIAKHKEKQEQEKILNYLKDNSKFIESMDFQKEKKESVGSTLGRGLLGAATGTTLSERDYTDENKTRVSILSVINYSNDKSYYPQLIDLVIETNKSLNKEWTRNGQYYSSKTEFYGAYISYNYKQILKDKKH
jgi:hypothetical protein